MTREARHHHQNRSRIHERGCVGASLNSFISSHVQKFLSPDQNNPRLWSTSRKPSTLLTSKRKRGPKSGRRKDEILLFEDTCTPWRRPPELVLVLCKSFRFTTSYFGFVSRLYKIPYAPIALKPKINAIIRLNATVAGTPVKRA